MKYVKPLAALLLGVTLFSCRDRSKEQVAANIENDSTESPVVNTASDTRPKDQLYFLRKIRDDSKYEITSNSLKKDAHIEAFNKYAQDSLKGGFKNWEFIVDEINDNQFSSNTISKFLGVVNKPVYNLKLVAPIKIDNSVDTIAIDNRVDFTFTVPKSPKGAALKKVLSFMKNLNSGDVIIVSGAVTHLDGSGKVNFASFYDDTLPWDVDLMIDEVRKK